MLSRRKRLNRLSEITPAGVRDLRGLLWSTCMPRKLASTERYGVRHELARARKIWYHAHDFRSLDAMLSTTMVISSYSEKPAIASS